MSGRICYIDGDFLPIDQASISILDRGLLLADSVYEVLRVENGTIFRSGQHYRRMMRGLEALAIATPCAESQFSSLCDELAQRNGIEQGSVYLQVTRGATERTHLVPRNIQPTLLGFASSADLPKWKDQGGSVGVITVSDTRWSHCGIKTTMLLPNSLAKQRANDAGAYEAVFVSEEAFVREGASTNVFVVLDGALHTHPTDGRILPGVTRAIVLDLARREGIATKEEAVRVEHLRKAGEMFLTGTTTDVAPVSTIDGVTFGGHAPGPITERLITRFAALLEAETAPAGR
jgi:D-alanine transaminase